MKVHSNCPSPVFCLAAIVVTLISFKPLMAQTPQTTATGQPSPVLVYLGPEFYTVDGKEFTRYRFTVENLDKYSPELFAPSPDLPPCGSNKRASRTWVDFYEQGGRRLYGFCALSKPQELNGIWFAVETGVVPPSWVYIEFTDRRTNTKYRSGLVETSQ